MKRKLVNLIAALALIAIPATSPLIAYAKPVHTAPTVHTTSTTPSTSTAPAKCSSGSNTAEQNQVLSGVGDAGSSNNCSDAGATNILKTVTNILSLVAGAVAVIMVITAGFKYITSSGDPNKVAAAKNTLIYALIGIAVAAFAQTLVHFVINKAN